MQVVVAALLDRSTRDQVRASLACHVHVQVYSCRRTALAALRKLPAVALLTDLAPGPALPAEAFVRIVRQRYPTLPVVAIVHLTSADMRALVQIAPVGVDGMIAVGIDSPWPVLRSLLASPVVDASAETVLSALRFRVRDDAWPFLTFVLRAAKTSMTVDDWSASLGIHRTTLLRRLRRVDLLPPATMLTLARLLVAAQLVGGHGWTVERTAATLHFSSASALRKSLRLHAGMCPSETRVVGGIDRVLNAVGNEFCRSLSRTTSVITPARPDDSKPAFVSV